MQVRSVAPPLLGQCLCLHFLLRNIFIVHATANLSQSLWITFLFNYENHGHGRNPLRWLTALQAVGRRSNEKGLRYTRTAGEVCQKLLLLKTKCSCETDSLGLSKNPQKQKLIVSSWRDKYGFPFYYFNSQITFRGHLNFPLRAFAWVLKSCLLVIFNCFSSEMWCTAFVPHFISLANHAKFFMSDIIVFQER